MGMPDAVTKMYIRENDVFADVVNYFLYGGEPVVLPDHLTELDPVGLMLLPGRKGKKRQWKRDVQKYRDVLKRAVIKNDAEAAYVIFGIENQTEVHYAMPVRNMLYDALQYSGQVDEAAARHREQQKQQGSLEKSKQQEFLSGFRKDDHLLPVVTFVILFNGSVWDGPKSLHEMMAVKKKELLEYVQDYRIHIIEPASMSASEFGRLRTNLREVLEYIKYSENPEKLQKLVEENPRMGCLNVKAAEVINAVTQTPIKIEEGVQTVNMCSAIQEMLEQSKNDGKIEGKIEGGIDMLVHLVKQSILNEKLAAAQAGMSVEQFQKEIKKRS